MLITRFVEHYGLFTVQKMYVIDRNNLNIEHRTCSGNMIHPIEVLLSRHPQFANQCHQDLQSVYCKYSNYSYQAIRVLRILYHNIIIS